jgi:guanylate kinase
MSNKRHGILFIVSAPSGTGKTTLVDRLVEAVPGLRKSCSFTSRSVHAGETNGIDYNFISRERFERMIEAGEFLEWADVFGNYYGTSAADINATLGRGEDLVLVIDVQGARQVRGGGRDTVGIFVLPPSAEILKTRLRDRSRDPEEQIRTRLRVARTEVGEFSGYEYVVVNDELDLAVDRLRGIVLAERARVMQMRDAAAAVIETFRLES